MTSPARALVRTCLRTACSRWPEHRRLFLVEDRSSWVIHWEMRALAATARRLGVRTAHPFWIPHARHQAIFYGSQFFLLADDWIQRPHQIATAYFHGKPGTGYEEFDRLHEKIRLHHDRISRLQVSHSEMETLLLETGIDPLKVQRIPIGIALNFFPKVTAETRNSARESLGLPPEAFVVGSFQKDGEGWGDGMNPKLIKGPDLFADTLARVKDAIPGLAVLLSGPARGYLRKRLGDLGIPCVHRNLDHYPDIHRLYHALDAYLVSSRQEGGPKAVLESMAAGIPLVTTRVGQAMDLVHDTQNGFMTGVDDVDGLAERLLQVARSRGAMEGLLTAARATAAAHDYPALDPLWKTFFTGFVEARS